MWFMQCSGSARKINLVYLEKMSTKIFENFMETRTREIPNFAPVSNKDKFSYLNVAVEVIILFRV